MRKRLHPAILLCILLILFSGCSKTRTQKQTLENIRISNLKTASSNLSQEELAFMEEICSILENAKYMRSADYGGKLQGQNTSQHELNLTLYFCGYNTDGMLTEKYVTTLNGLKQGQTFIWNQSTDHHSAENFMLIGSYTFQGMTYMTNPIPLQIISDQENSDIIISYADKLPTVVSLDQGWSDSVTYSIQDFSAVTDTVSDYKDVILYIRKESGKDNRGDSIDYRLLDKDGHVHHSGGTHVYLNRGETARLVFSIPIYEPGEYYLELQ